MAIREMDMYGINNNKNIQIAANRGTSGIEGTIATASGFAMGLKTPVTVMIGDLAFLHDLNSLSSLKSVNYPLIIILINNDGGGIFSFLPIAEFTDIFEPYFGTPHGLTFESAAKLFEIAYYQPQTQEEFIQVYQTALDSQKSCLIEVITERSKNYQHHQELQQKIKAVLK
jgi:2-succinyl-5-enolpyruvyl-6-hydroxy-3-cyclohexene-1-carboxylate synthase